MAGKKDKEDIVEELEDVCPKCGSVKIEEDGESVCPHCDTEIDYFGGDEDEL